MQGVTARKAAAAALAVPAGGGEPERGGTASGSCGVSYGGNTKLTVRPVMLVNGCGPSVRDLRIRLATRSQDSDGQMFGCRGCPTFKVGLRHL